MYKIALIRSDFFWYSRKLKLGSATMAKISKPKFVRKFESKRKFGELKLPDLLNQDLYNIAVVDRGVKTLVLRDSNVNGARSVSKSGSSSSSSAVYGGVKALASQDLDMERAISGSKFGSFSGSSVVKPLKRASISCIYDSCAICGGSPPPGMKSPPPGMKSSGSGGGLISLSGDYDIEMKMRVGLKLNNNRSEEEDRFEERVRDDDKKFHEGVPEYLYCPDGRGRKDQPTWDKYLQQIKDSGAYDISDYPGPAWMAPIRPFYDFKHCRRVLKTVTEVTDAAMKEINKSLMEDDEFEVHDILTVNVWGGKTSTYYITFEAKKKKIQQGGAPLITTFQTTVTKTFITHEIEVVEWRIKLKGSKPPS